MSQVKGIPYGISDFNRMRNENFYFVDKTMYLPLIEEMPSYLFLIRPRRFGKSLFLSMMRTYYDIAQKDNFDKYFGDLWIGSHPTKGRNNYQVLFFDFSKAGCSLPGADLMSSFNEYCSIIINQFAHAYASYYDEDFKSTVESIESAKAKLSYIEVKAKEKGYPLYLIIDEYDNFTNVILSEHGQKMFHDLTHASGFYREYFKQFKGMFDRIFLMGVSPITLDDLSSGYNIDWNISTDETFNAMMGFSESEVREMFRYYQTHEMLTGNIDAMITEMKPWYDNYCFARMSLNDDRIFNCDMTLYYLSSQVQKQRPPENMVDKNIRTDYSKLKMLARIDHDNTHEGSRMSTIEEIAAKGEILVDLHTSFPSEKIADIENFRSLLYYYGLLTMCGTRGDRLKMCIPNNCVREQYLGFLRDYYQQAHTLNLSHLKDLIDDFAFDGHWKPFFETIARAYRENSSIRDAIEGERNLQGFLKAYLAIASYYLVQPELEMNYGYCDFFLLPDKIRYSDIKHSYILELKYATRTATDAELETQAEEGRQQLLQYSKDKVVKKLATGTTLHLLLIQFQGWDMVKCEEIKELPLITSSNFQK
ncbi:ATP-binding protein [Bacteroides congonensis]|uniref:ATP-binding protein n=1 Tax=Bacteroides congonensis TaxID=1871006 RepID=UPI0026759B42|nr:ATP-binding protein [Bacteroides congonensis]